VGWVAWLSSFVEIPPEIAQNMSCMLLGAAIEARDQGSSGVALRVGMRGSVDNKELSSAAATTIGIKQDSYTGY
jgi:hypothetical protein